MDKAVKNWIFAPQNAKWLKNIKTFYKICNSAAIFAAIFLTILITDIKKKKWKKIVLYKFASLAQIFDQLSLKKWLQI